MATGLAGNAAATSAPDSDAGFALNGAIYERTQILVGNRGIERLHSANVLVVGVGGVGGHCAEALVRAGVGRLTLVDGDVVSATNKNRQLIALDSTIGHSKVEVLAARLTDISSRCRITTIDGFVLPEDVDALLDRERFGYVVDCIDSVECKLALLHAAVARSGLRIFSSGGAGGRLDPSRVRLCDLFETENDALSRMMRQDMRKCGIGPGRITVVSSDEKALPPLVPQRQENGGRDRAVNGTISYMPPLFGLLLSSAVIRHIVNPDAEDRAVAQRTRRLLRCDAEQQPRWAANRPRPAAAAGKSPSS